METSKLTTGDGTNKIENPNTISKEFTFDPRCALMIIISIIFIEIPCTLSAHSLSAPLLRRKKNCGVIIHAACRVFHAIFFSTFFVISIERRHSLKHTLRRKTHLNCCCEQPILQRKNDRVDNNYVDVDRRAM